MPPSRWFLLQGGNDSLMGSRRKLQQWNDLHLDEAKPYALFRESTTKVKDKRAVPLRPEIVEQLKAHRPKPDEAHTHSEPGADPRGSVR